MPSSFRARIFIVIAGLMLMTALTISIFQQLQMENHIINSEMAHAHSLLKMATLQIETQYESYIFYREALLKERKKDLENIVDLVHLEIESIYKKAKTGELTEEAAKQMALDYARRFRYADGSGYIWINTIELPHPILIMHPTMQNLEGHRMDSQDPLFNSAVGPDKNLFTAFVEATRDDGDGFVNYLWPKPTSSGVTESQPKLSFVRQFKPWNWIIGTGLYIDDIENESKLRITAIIKELRQAFARVKLSDNSYLFVFDGKYDLLVHPILEGKNLVVLQKQMAKEDLAAKFVAAAMNPGIPVNYSWDKPVTEQNNQTYEKKAFVQHFAPLDWYVVASVYCDEITSPLINLRWKILLLISVLLTLAMIIASMLARTLSNPLQELALAAQRLETSGIDAMEIPIGGTSETQKLGHCLNSMLGSINSVLNEKNLLLKEIQSEEEKMRTTLNSIADAVITTDTSGKIMGINPVAEALTGWNSSEATGRNLDEIYQVMNTNTRMPCKATVNRILESNGGAGKFSDLILTAKGGEEYYISEKGSPIRYENGQTIGMVLIFRNISEEFSNQQRLRDAEWKFHALYEHGPLGVAYHRMVYNSAGEPFDCYFIDANSNYQKLTGVDPCGKHIREVFPGIEKDSFNWIGEFGRAAKTGETIRFQQLLQANGRWYDCVAFQYKPDHFVAAFFEITEQRKLEQQLRQAQKMDAIGQLAGGIAHDFNNVLGGILGAAELLAMEIDHNAKANRYLALIQESSERASDLIRKLMAFGRQNNIVSTAVDAHVAAREAIALLKCSVDKKVKIDLSLNAERSMVIGDLSQLQNVFLNLGINASHAMPDGGLLIIESQKVFLDKTSASTYGLESGNYIKFEVRDTGCGIKAEHLSQIFEPFFTTKESGKGTGLGLAAAFGIIKQHRGAITVYSEVGKGTVFHIFLPITDKVKQSVSQVQAPVHGQGCILVIDDEQMIRTTASAILKQLGYDVLVADNGLEGLEIFQKQHQKIDLVMLDMIMPIMNGRECFTRMQKIKPEVKVILASGFSKEEDLQQMREIGLRGFINKPYSVSELSLLLQKVLNEKAPESSN